MPPSSVLSCLSRTTSATSTITSTSSDDLYATFISESTDATSRRTRKRFTNPQLMMLEQLYHENSHPSREQREMVAKSANMEVKSVTIWFQNKRQTERKTTLANGRLPPTVIINSSRSNYQRVPSPSMASSTSSTSTSASRRPSLDCVAARSELRAPSPRTPHRRHDPNAPLWENMPSSPIGPQFSPPAREFVEFGKEQRTRTLEWACARRRLADPGLASDDEDTDVEPVEAVTPGSTWGEGDPRWSGKNQKKGGRTLEVVSPAAETATPAMPASFVTEPDDDTMKAALALCGLMRG
ncbi:homeodomain transcription factor [Mycena pura]|uniref:Homeodomain transcription factor n=1 Tax=Mycena pura TaxID=153505 RepID=A0AAD6YGL3_9AGAR|nr:homeodomain transcription factor [Mycena pura]